MTENTTLPHAPAVKTEGDANATQIALQTPPAGAEAVSLSPTDREALSRAFADKGIGGMRSFWQERNTKLKSEMTEAASAAGTSAKDDGLKDGSQTPPSLLGDAKPADGESVNPLDDPATAKATDIKLQEISGGAMSLQSITQLAALTEPFVAELTALTEAQGVEAASRQIEAGDAEVLSRVYNGSEAAMTAGLSSIVGALEGMYGDKALAILTEINDSAILSSPTAHFRVLQMAKKFSG